MALTSPQNTSDALPDDITGAHDAFAAREQALAPRLLRLRGRIQRSGAVSRLACADIAPTSAEIAAARSDIVSTTLVIVPTSAVIVRATLDIAREGVVIVREPSDIESAGAEIAPPPADIVPATAVFAPEPPVFTIARHVIETAPACNMSAPACNVSAPAEIPPLVGASSSRDSVFGCAPRTVRAPSTLRPFCQLDN